VETPYIICGRGNQPRLNSLYLALINLYPLGRNYIAQEYHFKREEQTFLEVVIKLFLLKYGHDLL